MGESMRIAHIGSFNRNLGDNIAILNVQKQFDKLIPNIDWVNLDILEIFWSRNNNIDFVINFFKDNKFDAIVVGGGGLIEYRGYEKHQTHFKLQKVVKTIDILLRVFLFIGASGLALSLRMINS